MKEREAAYIAGILDGEESITLTNLHEGENRRPCISISSNDIEMLENIRNIAGGTIYPKKNYNPQKHQDSFSLYFKRKTEVYNMLIKTKKLFKSRKKAKTCQLDSEPLRFSYASKRKI